MKKTATQTVSRDKGARRTVLALLLPAVFAVAAFAAPSIAAEPVSTDAVVESGVNVPSGFPSSDDRFVPPGSNGEFRAYFAHTGAKTWDGWTVGSSQDSVVTDAKNLLNNHDKYTHCFVENTSNNKVVWTSWDS